MKRILTAFLLALCVLCLAPGISGAASPGVYYQYFASSPHPDFTGECLVVQWYQINHLSNYSDYFDIEAILFADGRILLQYGPGNPEEGLYSTVGIQTAAGNAVEYFCEYGYGGLPFNYQEKSYDAPDLTGMSLGPLPGSMAMLFTPADGMGLPDFQPSLPPVYTLSSAPYYMVDIHDSGDNINIYGDDTYAGSFDIGFDFPFFGSSYDEFYASTNCLLSFNGGSSDFSNSCLPTDDPDLDMIAVYWDDMYISDTPYVAGEEETAEDVYTKYKDYTKNKKDKKFLGIECFINAAAGGTNMLFPLLMAAACAAGGFLSRKRMSK